MSTKYILAHVQVQKENDIQNKNICYHDGDFSKPTQLYSTDQTRKKKKKNQCEEKCSVSKKSNLQIQYKEVTKYFLYQKKI